MSRTDTSGEIFCTSTAKALGIGILTISGLLLCRWLFKPSTNDAHTNSQVELFPRSDDVGGHYNGLIGSLDDDDGIFDWLSRTDQTKENGLAGLTVDDEVNV